MFNSVVQWGKISGQPITWREYTLVPQTRSLRIRLPFGGLVWNRPLGVSVRSAGGEAQMVRVRDRTRWLQLAIVACAFACSGLLAAVGRRFINRS